MTKISNFVLIMKIILTKIFSHFLNCLLSPTFQQIFDLDYSVRLSLFGRPRFGLIGNSVRLSPLAFLGCCIVAYFIMEASTDQKNFHDIMRIMAVNIGPNYFHKFIISLINSSLRSNPHYENNFDRQSRHFPPKQRHLRNLRSFTFEFSFADPLISLSLW